MTAIQATFSDFKLVKSRKVAQLVMEVPIEQADHAVKALGGLPQFSSEQWVGIAPLKREAAEKERKSWGDLGPAQQAGIRCAETAFQAWVGVDPETPGASEKTAAWVRGKCGVTSRSEFARNPEAAAKWAQIDRDFRVEVRA